MRATFNKFLHAMQKLGFIFFSRKTNQIFVLFEKNDVIIFNLCQAIDEKKEKYCFLHMIKKKVVIHNKYNIKKKISFP